MQRSLSRTGDDFVVVEYDVSSQTTRSGVYVGMFADYDVSSQGASDRGGFDAATRTVYAFIASATGNRNYYGVTLLGRPQSGWSVSADPADAGLFTALSSNGTTATANGDRRLVIGAGPLTLTAGVPQTVRFAYVGGTDFADLTASSAAAQTLSPVGGESDPGTLSLALGPATPNPLSSTGTLTFTLGQAGAARLAVYDVLGREVLLVAGGMRTTGEHTVRLDVASLSPGLYTCRLSAGGETVTRRLTVVR